MEILTIIIVLLICDSGMLGYLTRWARFGANS
jgi:hypothetical protein